MIARESKEAELVAFFSSSFLFFRVAMERLTTSIVLWIYQKKSKYYDWAYQKYLLWELGVKRPNFNLVKILFERAVHDVPKSVELWDSYLEYMVRPFRSQILIW